jgi:oxygen-independent coproporphyrinogen III oxidase
MKRPLLQRMNEGGYDGYAYAYPHKTAYRRLKPPVPLADAWQLEDKRNLFLYVHLPFCEMRCGFCNLFTAARPASALVTQTLAAIRRQSDVVASSVAPERIVQAAVGGGTPSLLSLQELEDLFEHFGQTWSVRWSEIPVSFELSPGTVTLEKLALLRRYGVERVSLGVQSFVAKDLIALKRPQVASEVQSACEAIRDAGFRVFNIDLIYGNDGQDTESWQHSLERALEWRPEELYLYPLYIRKLTGLERCGKRPGERRRELYRQGRDCLLSAGYRQVSMRLFRRSDVRRHGDYCCQDDGMVGLGPGARSYTRALHYSPEYATGQTGVRAIIENFNIRDAARHASADYGVFLDQDEQKLRYFIKSLLRAEGVSPAAYTRRFGGSVADDFPQARELAEAGLLAESNGVVRLNDAGLMWSDTIGPWLYSEAVTERMSGYELA